MMTGELTLGEKPVSVPLGPPQIQQGLWCLSVLVLGNKKKMAQGSFQWYNIYTKPR